MKKLFIFLGAAILLTGSVQAIVVKPIGPTLSPQDMAQILTGEGVEVFNVQYTGANRASGVFCSGSDTIGIESGILLTSGCVTNVLGTNILSNATCDNGLAGDADLNATLLGETTLDASVLEFDFIPDGDTVVIRYVFGSEEYNEFVDAAFNDVFAFFVNGVNYALIPGALDPVSINNVNNGHAEAGTSASGPCRNCGFFRDNANLASPPIQIELDGITTVLTLTAPVIPGETNRFKMAIADVADRLLDSAVFIQARSLSSGTPSTNCLTRTAGYWFRHPKCPGTKGITTATLDEALKTIMALNCDVVDLGFMLTPVTFRNTDDTLDYKDALIEALGLRWRPRNLTGEFGGTSSLRLPNSALCRARKALSVQYIAALANNLFFNTDPVNCQYVKPNGVLTNFPPDTIQAARNALAGESLADIMQSRVLLKKFNASGNSTPLPADIADPDQLACGAFARAKLRQMGRDPTTQFNCPGRNDDCQRGENIQAVPFTASVSLADYTDLVGSPTCADGGREAVWKIPANIAGSFRPFTITTDGSAFNTLLSVRLGSCDGEELACNLSDRGLITSRIQFQAPENNVSDIFVIAEGRNGAYGTLKIKITSP